ncbi:MAG: zinc-binding dehydrogenase [bacterium]|nr:zinc-binding dehydrogenase [bacterium]
MPSIVAAVMTGAHQPLELRELSEPDLEPDSALLATELSEVCGTDVHLHHGRLTGVPYPIIPGHVAVGRLEKIRGRLDDVDGRPLAEGDRVTFLDVHRTCNRCIACLVDKATTRCPSRKVYGITYGLADGLTGGWAEKIYLKPGVRCIRLDGVAPSLYMAGGCALPTALHAVERGGIQLGQSVLVLGSGPVGLAMIALSRLRGAARVLCIGAPVGRLQTARRMGATDVLDLTAADEDARRTWVREHTGGRGADVTLEATGAPVAVAQALRWTRDAGVVVIAGQYTDGGDVSINPHHDLNRKHLDIRGCWGSDFAHFYRGVELLKDPLFSKAWESLDMTRFTLSQADQALQAVANGEVVKALIVPQA